ncbi:16S rRNA (adenine(1518)-N(6)/adenine(1519)-N(6))-dimethyltransferase RsmA [Cohaesibacter celericrescens]|uniref:Ribosomal RNA small subunit methyltransferase A n=1 Tax=Cohaesibacter celericrescens TaxID=2067669 RepID=A0A2N5XS92_9HYPH|nr:16S rRNA (adenine(1518)-N(6)/adenine(1519)-N(6))-dimethyltransferase RsmA [Cohaesibacter celericrescens]PLW77396.1 16S rRNA (adenine(1518)-N(6)/adenine(1519)-N(6))-dimethyltransferase [Cohaesibacter celericrescens]
MAQIDNLPPLRDVIERHDLRAKKSLGQNFLLDLNLTCRIARAAGDLSNHTVIEVGPGPGGLTRALLHEGAKKVIAIEMDPRAMGALQEIADHYPGRLDIIQGDALKVDVTELAPEGPVRIVANLPYNVGTQLLLGWLEQDAWPPFYDSLTLMFQKEVAERITATEQDKAYGRLGVIAGWRTHADKLFDVSREAFSPPPKVTSSIVHLTPKSNPLPCKLRYLEKITAAAFGQRRKMLRQSLKSLGVDHLALLEEAGLLPTQRAETVPVDQFVSMANILARIKPD